VPEFKFRALQEFDVTYVVEADTKEEAEELLWEGYGEPTGTQWPGEIVDVYLEEDD
jgi:hypothetical protein